MFKVNNINTRTRCEICSELTNRSRWHRSRVFIVAFEQISRLTPSISIINFEQENVGWELSSDNLVYNPLSFLTYSKNPFFHHT